MSHRDKVPRLDSSDDDSEWQPPTEAEMKIIQAKRERQDKISKIMGDYLLKGYTMLGSVCDICGTILLRDKTGKNYCVTCSELDSDISKDDPALNREAARRQVQEQEQRSATSYPHSAEPQDFEDAAVPDLFSSCHLTAQHNPDIPQSSRNLASSSSAQDAVLPTASGLLSLQSALENGGVKVESSQILGNQSNRSLETRHCDSTECDLQQTKDALFTKLRWATCELQSSTAVVNSISLCQLIKSCAEAIEAVRRVEGK